MTKSYFIVILFFCLLFPNCQTKDKQAQPPNLNWEQVLSIAEEYGIRDSMNQTKTKSLIYYKEIELHKYMKRLAEIYTYEKKRSESLKKIRSLDEYWKFLEDFPREKSALYKTEANFLAEKKEYSDPDWIVYINRSGNNPSFTFIKKSDGDWTPGPHDELLPKHSK